MRDRLKIWYYTELKKLYALNWREKIEYVWNYYKLWIIGIVFFLSLTVFLIVRITANVEGFWLNGSFANTTVRAGSGSLLWEDFEACAQFDLKEKKLEFDDQVYFDYLKNQARGNNYYNAFVSLTDAGILDFIVMAPDSLSALAQSGRLTDLRLEQTKALLERYADRLIYFQSETDGAIPVGIDLSDSLLVTKYRVYSPEEGCAMGICARTGNLEQIALFLQFVLEEG